MKRTLIALVCLLMVFFSVTTASAAGSWHYCELCGREHSGVNCPESCQNDCAENRNGNVHKWYECPERVVSNCMFCGELTDNHNENCCPSGEIVWNDLKGTFRAGEYSYEEGTRMPQYCSYCGFFGYHSDGECLKNPNRIPVVTATPEVTATPVVTATPEVTAVPASPVITATPVITAEPTAYVCTHVDTEVESSKISYTQCTADYCYVTTYLNVTKCKNCGEELNRYESFDRREHNFVSGKCNECGYTVYVSTDSSNSKECSHNNVATRRVSTVRHTVSEDGKKCYATWTNEVYCTDCYVSLGTEQYTKESEHYFQMTGVCPNCGKVRESSSNDTTETVQPEATSEPTVEPTNDVVTDNNQTVTESKKFDNDWVTIALAILVFVLLYNIVKQLLKEAFMKKRRSRRNRKLNKEEADEEEEVDATSKDETSEEEKEEEATDTDEEEEVDATSEDETSKEEKEEATDADEEGYFE